MHALIRTDLLYQVEPSLFFGNKLLQTHQQHCKAAGQNSKGTAPRFERLMDRLDLTDKERLAMLFVLVKQVSQEDFSNLFPKFGRSPPSFAAFAGLVSIGTLPWHSSQLQYNMQLTLYAFTSAL